MNASERLQAIIKQRLEGEAFGWGLILSVWAGVLALRMFSELLTGPTLVGGTLAVGAALGFQVFWSRRSAAPAAARSWTLQGLWVLLAAALWFLGSVAPALGLLTPLAGAVLELLFLAGGVVQTGIMKSRPRFWIAGLTLAAASVAMAALPFIVPARGLLVAVVLGVPAVLTARAEKKTS